MDTMRVKKAFVTRFVVGLGVFGQEHVQCVKKTPGISRKRV